MQANITIFFVECTKSHFEKKTFLSISAFTSKLLNSWWSKFENTFFSKLDYALINKYFVHLVVMFVCLFVDLFVCLFIFLLKVKGIWEIRSANLNNKMGQDVASHVTWKWVGGKKQTCSCRKHQHTETGFLTLGQGSARSNVFTSNLKL